MSDANESPRAARRLKRLAPKKKESIGDQLLSMLTNGDTLLQGAKFVAENGREICLAWEAQSIVRKLLGSPSVLFQKEFVFGDLMTFLLNIYIYVSENETNDDASRVQNLGMDLAALALRALGGNPSFYSQLPGKKSITSKLKESLSTKQSNTDIVTKNLKLSLLIYRILSKNASSVQKMNSLQQMLLLQAVVALVGAAGYYQRSNSIKKSAL